MYLKLPVQVSNKRPEANYSMLPMYREVLIDADLAEYSKMDEIAEYRWITSLKRIDWYKFFNQERIVHELAQLAARCISTNPVGFLNPDLVNTALQKYTSKCPNTIKEYAISFDKAARKKNWAEMKEWFEIIENLV